MRTAYHREGAAGFVPKGNVEALVTDLERVRRELIITDFEARLSKIRRRRLDVSHTREGPALVVTLALRE